MDLRLMAVAVATVLLASACGLFAEDVAVSPASPTPQITLDETEGQEPPHSEYTEVIDGALPSVVNVRVRALQQGPAGITEASGQGSGVIIDESGVILTNNHVVACALKVQVHFTGEQEPVTGTVVGTAPEKDLAVVRVEAEGLEAIEIGNSSKLRLGDEVVAIGFPLALDVTATQGIISGRERVIEPQGAPAPLEGVLQTDAAINPGNSGGALVDMAGRLVGINTAAAGAGFAENIGFAIAIDEALPVVEEILTQEREERAFLGVSVSSVDSAALALQLGLDPDTRGVLIRDVFDDGAADQAGLRAGDLITRIGESTIGSGGDLTEVLAGLDPGDAVEVEVINVESGEQRTETVELQARPLCPQE